VADKLKATYGAVPDEAKIDEEYDGWASGLSIVLFKDQLLKSYSAKPFFAFFNFITPHFKYETPIDFRYKFGGEPSIYQYMASEGPDLRELALIAGNWPIDVTKFSPFYDATLNYLDFLIGDLLDWLRRRDLYDESLIIITSDHGEHLGENGRFSHQLSIEEELLRIPLIIKFPGGAFAGQQVDSSLASNIDVYKTILEFAREGGNDQRFPTASVDLSDPTTVGRDQLISEYYVPEAELEFMLENYEDFDDSPHRKVRRAVFKDGFKFTFKDLESGKIMKIEEGKSETSKVPDIGTVTESLKRYVNGLKGAEMDILDPDQAPNDPEFLRALRTLGYIE